MIEHNNKMYHEELDWKHSVVERSVRAVVKLMNIEDTSLLENMKQVQDHVKKILEENHVFDSKEEKNVFDSKDEEPFDAEEQTNNDDVRKVTKPKKKRRSELERLLEDKEKMFETIEMSDDNMFSIKVYSTAWSDSREKADYLAPTEEENRSAMHYNKVMNSFTKSPVNFTMHMMNSCENLSTNLYWPASITKEDEVGQTTLAIQTGATKMIADGVEVVGHGEQEGEGDGETEVVRADDYYNDVFLL